MVTQFPRPKSLAPAPKVAGHTLYPADLEGYLSAMTRVQAIAHLKFKIKLSVLIGLPPVQAFLADQQGLDRQPILRLHLAEMHWLALVDWLQQKSTQEVIRNIIPTLSEADQSLPSEPGKSYLPNLIKAAARASIAP